MINYSKRLLRRLIFETDGATAVEYAVMLAMIIIAAIGAILNSGNVQQAIWTDTADNIGNAVSQPGLTP